MLPPALPSLQRAAVSLFALAVLLAATVCAWGLITDPLRHLVTSPQEVDAAADARRYLLQHPFDAAGWLARAGAAQAGDANVGSPMAAQSISVASLLAPVDPQVLRARTLLALKQGDVVSGLSLAADFAVLFPTERHDAFLILLAHTADPQWSTFLKARLDSGWPVAESFLLDSCQSGAPLGTLLALAQQILRQQALADNTVTCIGSKAIAEGHVQAARWLWINALAVIPSPLGNVFNGDFEQPLAARLFDWQISAGGEYREGFSAAIRNDDSRGRVNKVLMIRFNGRSLTSPVAQQFLALLPGRYSFSYALRESGMSVPAAVSWVLRCVPPGLTPALGAALRQPAQSGWINHSQDLTIPVGCDGQLLDLDLGNRQQMVQGLQGSVLFDDINIVRR